VPLTVTRTRCSTFGHGSGFRRQARRPAVGLGQLSAEGVARFPFPPHGRIPNFAGAEVAAARLLNIEPWKSATAIKVNQDSPQRRCELKRCAAASRFSNRRPDCAAASKSSIRVGFRPTRSKRPQALTIKRVY
jgi:hypothetical protein